jgi:hypothetical protein
VEDWRRSVWVGGSSTFFVDDDLLAAWEFELLLQKKEDEGCGFLGAFFQLLLCFLDN